MKTRLSAAAAALLLAAAAPAAFAQAEVVSPAASGSISGTMSGTNPVNPAPSGVGATGDATDNRGSTGFGDPAPAASDSMLLGAVISALASDPALRGADLQVEVDRGTVGITGHALTPGQAARAGRIAAQAAGGARVETDIGFE